MVYTEFYTQMRFASAPIFITTQGHSPTAARGTWDLVRGILVNGELARWIKEIMFVAISHDRSCRYCRAAHIACCRMLKVDPGGRSTETFVHDFWEEVYIVEGSQWDGDQFFKKGMYACRPPGMKHGPYRTDEGVVTLEVRYMR